MAEPGFNMEACVARVRLRDERAAAEFVRALHPLVLKLVRAHLPRRTSEEDLCQSVFIKILNNLGQYSGQVPIEHWVSRITVNTCLNALKAEGVRPELRWADLSQEQADLLDAVSTDATQGDPASDMAARDLVEQLLASLDPRDRLLITMLHLEGYSMDDISQKTGWSIANIKVRAFRARQKLRSAYEALEKSR